MATEPTDAALAAAAEEVMRLEQARADALRERDRLIAAAVRAGRTQSEVARLAGVTRMRVNQVMREARR